MEKPPSYVVHGHEDTLYTLKKALYGMKHDLRAWYSRIEAFLISNGFNRNSNKPTLNRKENKNDTIWIVCFYVDIIFYKKSIHKHVNKNHEEGSSDDRFGIDEILS